MRMKSTFLEAKQGLKSLLPKQQQLTIGEDASYIILFSATPRLPFCGLLICSISQR